MQPRRFDFKGIFKRRGFKKPRRVTLQYGQQGVITLQPLRLNSKQIFRYKIFLKKAARKFDKTRRRVWFNAFPFLPLSRKIVGSRMGKGTGKLSGWAADLPSGINLVEFKNLRSGRADYYCTQVRHKLPVQSRVVRRVGSWVRLPLNLSRAVRYMSIQ